MNTAKKQKSQKYTECFEWSPTVCSRFCNLDWTRSRCDLSSFISFSICKCKWTTCHGYGNKATVVFITGGTVLSAKILERRCLHRKIQIGVTCQKMVLSNFPWIYRERRAERWKQKVGSRTFLIWLSFSFTNASRLEFEAGCRNSLSNLATSFCKCLTSALSDMTTLTWAFVTTSFAQLPNNRVFLDCSIWLVAGLSVQMMAVLALPPKDGCNMRVSFESLYGICALLPMLHT